MIAEATGMVLAAVVDGVVKRHGKAEFELVIEDSRQALLCMERDGEVPKGTADKIVKMFRERWILP